MSNIGRPIEEIEFTLDPNDKPYPSPVEIPVAPKPQEEPVPA